MKKIYAALTFLGGLTAIASLHGANLCISEGRFVSNETIEDNSIALANREETIFITPPHVKEAAFYPVVRYENNEEFKKSNPNCCIVGLNKVSQGNWPDSEGWSSPSIIDLITGGYANAVGMKYTSGYEIYYSL